MEILSEVQAPVRRGDDTRQALIEAAIALFGEHGRASTSTRMIADQAGANVASISYYFGSKDGLYRAVIQYIADRISSYMVESNKSVFELLNASDISKDDAHAAIHTLFDSFTHLLLDSDEPMTWMLIVIREQAKPTEAFDVLYNPIMRPLQDAMSRLVAIYTGLPEDSDEIKIRVHTYASLVLGFLTSRESFLRHMGKRELDADDIAAIRSIIQSSLDACLKMEGS